MTDWTSIFCKYINDEVISFDIKSLNYANTCSFFIHNYKKRANDPIVNTIFRKQWLYIDIGTEEGYKATLKWYCQRQT